MHWSLYKFQIKILNCNFRKSLLLMYSTFLDSQLGQLAIIVVME
jgi:hypothetical protein